METANSRSLIETTRGEVIYFLGEAVTVTRYTRVTPMRIEELSLEIIGT